MSIETLPCCTACQIGYVPLKNDILVVEMMEDNKPYKLWSADLVECPICYHRVITGFGRNHIAEHYEPSFQTTLARAKLHGLLFTINGKRMPMRDWDGSTN